MNEKLFIQTIYFSAKLIQIEMHRRREGKPYLIEPLVDEEES